jgi:integrase
VVSRAEKEQKPKVLRSRIPPPTNEDIRKLLAACDEYGRKFGITKIGMVKRRHWVNVLKLRILIPLAIGSRVSESVALKRKDFDLDRKVVRIERAYIYHDPRKLYDRNGRWIRDPSKLPPEKQAELKKGDGWHLREPKQHSVGTLPIDDDYLLQQLKEIFIDLRFKPDDYIMSVKGKLLWPCTLRSNIKHIAKAAGLDPSSVFPHIFRKKFGTTRADLLGPKYASELLRHSPNTGGQTLFRSYWKHSLDEIRAVGSQSLRTSMASILGPEKKKESLTTRA